MKATGKLGAMAMAVIEGNKIRIQGPLGSRVCRLDQPMEIGICIVEVLTNNKLEQAPYRTIVTQALVVSIVEGETK